MCESALANAKLWPSALRLVRLEYGCTKHASHEWVISGVDANVRGKRGASMCVYMQTPFVSQPINLHLSFFYNNKSYGKGDSSCLFAESLLYMERVCLPLLIGAIIEIKRCLSVWPPFSVRAWCDGGQEVN